MEDLPTPKSIVQELPENNRVEERDPAEPDEDNVDFDADEHLDLPETEKENGNENGTADAADENGTADGPKTEIDGEYLPLDVQNDNEAVNGEEIDDYGNEVVDIGDENGAIDDVPEETGSSQILKWLILSNIPKDVRMSWSCFKSKVKDSLRVKNVGMKG